MPKWPLNSCGMVILDGSQLKQHTHLTFLWLFTTNTKDSAHIFVGCWGPFPHWHFSLWKTNYRQLRLLNQLRAEELRLSLPACFFFLNLGIYLQPEGMFPFLTFIYQGKVSAGCHLSVLLTCWWMTQDSGGLIRMTYDILVNFTTNRQWLVVKKYWNLNYFPFSMCHSHTKMKLLLCSPPLTQEWVITI